MKNLRFMKIEITTIKKYIIESLLYAFYFQSSQRKKNNISSRFTNLTNIRKIIHASKIKK